MKAIKGTASKIVIFSMVAAFLVTGSVLYSLAAGDTPVTPNNFYGSLTIDGSQAGTGTRIKAMVGAEDKTSPSPYTTGILGQYGCLVFECSKFGVDCTQGQEIIFSVEVSPGNFFNANETASCNPGADTNLDLTVTTGSGPVCGDAQCNGQETCSSCPGDCGTCPPVCGDQSCNGAETCATCPGDCGVCPPTCGDQLCNGVETCSSCPGDCGACPPVCGDLSCNGQETCSSCPGDCGACPPTCGDQSCNDGETCSNCPGDCGACPPVCGNGNVEGAETCELPSTSNNPFCGQSTSQCLDKKLGTRDAFGNCNSVCGCAQDQFNYSCVMGQCGAECSVDSDCDDQNQSTVDTCWGDCTCLNTPLAEYCLVITNMRVLNATFDQDSTIPAGTMYNIEISTYNSCDAPVSTLQIVQVLKGAMPVNLGTVAATIPAAETSTITVGFIMPNGTSPGTGFTAKGFNWNHWIDQSPGTFQILSDTSQVGFQSQ